MKRTFYLLLVGIAISIGLISCEDGSVGSSISQTNVDVVMDSSFTITGYSSANGKVQSRTTAQLLGLIKADNYGELRSDFVTQFMPSLKLDTLGVTANSIDSVKLIFRIPKGGFVGDSLTPMRLSVYALNKQLPNPIYSDFNPSEYYSTSNLMGSTSYTASAIGLSDSIKNLKYREVKVKMPIEFGRKFFQEYKDNPNTFSTPSTFAQYFPGVYVTTTYGNGRVMHIENTVMTWYYRKTLPLTEEKDTTYHLSIDYLASTPEIVTNNNIKLNIANSIQNDVAEGQTIIQAPAGLDVVLNFPVQQIIDKYLSSLGSNLGVFNTLYFEIPVEAIDSKSGINPPPYLLLVKASEKDKFFASNSITNDVSSYYAAYSKTKKAYIFSDMRDYIRNIIKDEDGKATVDDATLVLTPVAISTETNSSTGAVTITNIAPYVDGPAIVKLDLDKAKIKMTFTKQTLNF